jgi:hypothetical protein
VRAATADELDRDVEIGLARGKPFGEREGIAGLDQHMEAPALHFRALTRVGLG